MKSKIALGLMVLAGLAMVFQGLRGCFDGSLLGGRGGSSSTTVAPPPAPAFNTNAMPEFNSDSAYAFVKKQVAFGPRVPNSAAHKRCAAYLANTFRQYGLTVVEQKFSAKHYKGTNFDCVNIIGQYKPEAPKRILLAAHWDSRFMADKDDRDTLKPIDGADDGASGVAVLLEVARQLKAMPPDIGVDLICFDAEDQGDDDPGALEDTWCLGAQHWAKNMHRTGYNPYYAILLDMVGAKGALFKKEGISMEIAPSTVNRIWELASQLGYGQYFPSELGGGITDDHLYVIRHARIPMIDIISTPGDSKHAFGAYHHTHDDNISVIDPTVLDAVGQVMLAIIYRS